MGLLRQTDSGRSSRSPGNGVKTRRILRPMDVLFSQMHRWLGSASSTNMHGQVGAMKQLGKACVDGGRTSSENEELAANGGSASSAGVADLRVGLYARRARQEQAPGKNSRGITVPRVGVVYTEPK